MLLCTFCSCFNFMSAGYRIFTLRYLQISCFLEVGHDLEEGLYREDLLTFVSQLFKEFQDHLDHQDLRDHLDLLGLLDRQPFVREDLCHRWTSRLCLDFLVSAVKDYPVEGVSCVVVVAVVVVGAVVVVEAYFFFSHSQTVVFWVLRQSRHHLHLLR